jgi:general secretion pathway protein H
MKPPTLRHPHRRRQPGFTIIELMVVVALIAVASGVVALALRDGASHRLEHEAARLSALLESARAEARASGLPVRFELAVADNAEGNHFHFVGLPASAAMPTRWLDAEVGAEIIGARSLSLGPEPLIGAQRIVLRLDDRRIVLATDGLRAFAPAPEVTTAAR